MSTSDAHIGDIRAFNRFYTRLVGALDAGLLKTAFTLAEARVLYEIGTRGQVSHGELAGSLGLDPGYLTRLNFKLTDAGLVGITPGISDRRQNFHALTREGEAAFAELNAASDASIGELLNPLDAADQADLIAAMVTIRNLLGDDTLSPAPIILRPHRAGDIGYIVGRQGALYAEEYGWDASYEGLAAEIAGQFLQDHDPSREFCLIAEQRGKVVGSVFLVDAGDAVGQLRLLYVEPSARGQGIGGMLVEECIQRARRIGYRRIKLWTQSILLPARKIYARAGFRLVRAEPHRSFGHDLVGEYWELEL